MDYQQAMNQIEQLYQQHQALFKNPFDEQGAVVYRLAYVNGEFVFWRGTEFMGYKDNGDIIGTFAKQWLYRLDGSVTEEYVAIRLSKRQTVEIPHTTVAFVTDELESLYLKDWAGKSRVRRGMVTWFFTGTIDK